MTLIANIISLSSLILHSNLVFSATFPSHLPSFSHSFIPYCVKPLVEQPPWRWTILSSQKGNPLCCHPSLEEANHRHTIGRQVVLMRQMSRALCIAFRSYNLHSIQSFSQVRGRSVHEYLSPTYCVPDPIPGAGTHSGEHIKAQKSLRSGDRPQRPKATQGRLVGLFFLWLHSAIWLICNVKR